MAGAGGIRAGKAYVELFADKSPLVRGLKEAGSAVKGFGAGLANVGSFGMSGAVGTIAETFGLSGINAANLSLAGLAAGGALSLKVFADAGSELADMSARTGASVESLGKLGYAAGQTGTDMAGMEKGVKKLQDNLGSAMSGNKAAADSFSSLGLNFSELASLPVDQQFALIADKLDGIQNPAQKTAAAINLFGKAGTDLLPMFAGGAAGLTALTSRADQLGIVMSGKDADAADLLGDRLDDLSSLGKRTSQVIGAALAPAATDLADKLISVVVATNQWIQDNPQVVTTIAQVTAGVAAGGAALVALGTSISLVGTSINGVANLLPLLSSPLVLTGGLATVGYLIATQTEIGQAGVQALADTFPGAAAVAGDSFDYIAATAKQLGTDVGTTWGGISDAVAAGDLALAGEVAMAGLNVVWQTGWREISDIYTVVSTSILDGWNGVTSSMAVLGENFAATMSSIWVDIKGMAFDAMNAIASKWDSISGGLADIIIDAGVSSGVIKGDAEEIKKARREDTARRQAGRDEAGATSIDDRSKQKAEIEANRVAGVGGIKTAQIERSAELQRKQDASLTSSEKKLAEAREKLAAKRTEAGDAAAFEENLKNLQAAVDEADDKTKKRPGETDVANAPKKTPKTSAEHAAEATVSGLAASRTTFSGDGTPDEKVNTLGIAASKTATELGMLAQAAMEAKPAFKRKEHNEAMAGSFNTDGSKVGPLFIEDQINGLKVPGASDFTSPVGDGGDAGGFDVSIFGELKSVLSRLDSHLTTASSYV